MAVKRPAGSEIAQHLSGSQLGACLLFCFSIGINHPQGSVLNEAAQPVRWTKGMCKTNSRLSLERRIDAQQICNQTAACIGTHASHPMSHN